MIVVSLISKWVNHAITMCIGCSIPTTGKIPRYSYLGL